MAYVHNYSDGVNRPRFASKSDKTILGSRSEALAAIDGEHLSYVHNELKRALGISDPKRCEAKKDEVLKSYLFELERRMALKKKPVSQADMQLVKTAFLTRCDEIFSHIIVSAVLQMRKPKQAGVISEGRFSTAFMPRYVKYVAKQFYGMEM